MFKLFALLRRRHRKVVAQFLDECSEGKYGRTKADMESAVERVLKPQIPAVDWATVMAIVVQYLPLILAFLGAQR